MTSIVVFNSNNPWVGGIVEIPVVRGAWLVDAGAPVERQPLPTDPVGAATLTLSGLPVGTDIVVLAAGTTTVLLQVDAHPTSSYTYTYNVYTADTLVDIGFICPGYELQYKRNLTLPRSNSLLPIDLRADRNFV